MHRDRAGSVARFAVVLVASAALGGAQPVNYRISPAEGARFVLEVHKTGVMSGKKHIFVYEKYDGALSYDRDQPAASTIRLEIDAASAGCKDTWVSQGQLADIQKYALEDMMAVAEHPRIVFRSESVQPDGAGNYDVGGQLTIRGRTQPVTVKVRLSEEGQRLRFTGDAIVNLEHYDINPRNRFLGLIGTKKEMDVQFELIAERSVQ